MSYIIFLKVPTKIFLNNGQYPCKPVKTEITSSKSLDWLLNTNDSNIVLIRHQDIAYSGRASLLTLISSTMPSLYLAFTLEASDIITGSPIQRFLPCLCQAGRCTRPGDTSLAQLPFSCHWQIHGQFGIIRQDIN